MRKRKTMWERIERIEKKRKRIAKKYAKKYNVTLLAEFEDPIFADKFCEAFLNRLGRELVSKQDKRLERKAWEEYRR